MVHPWGRKGSLYVVPDDSHVVFQNKIVDRCERLQLQSAAIARHVDEVLPAKDQGVQVSPDGAWGSLRGGVSS